MKLFRRLLHWVYRNTFGIALGLYIGNVLGGLAYPSTATPLVLVGICTIGWVTAMLFKDAFYEGQYVRISGIYPTGSFTRVTYDGCYGVVRKGKVVVFTNSGEKQSQYTPDGGYVYLVDASEVKVPVVKSVESKQTDMEILKADRKKEELEILYCEMLYEFQQWAESAPVVGDTVYLNDTITVSQGGVDWAFLEGSPLVITQILYSSQDTNAKKVPVKYIVEASNGMGFSVYVNEVRKTLGTDMSFIQALAEGDIEDKFRLSLASDRESV